MRLIDADELKNEVDTWGCNDYDKHDFIEAIDNAPTIHGIVGFVERPQGEWIEGTQGWYCSVCGEIDKYHYDHIYCGCCGADMRGGAE